MSAPGRPTSPLRRCSAFVRSLFARRPGLETLVILAVIVASLAIGLFVQNTMRHVREALPAKVLAQQRDISYVVHDLSDLVRAVEMARLDPAPARVEDALRRVRASTERLSRIRRTYNFDNLIGASAVHAVVNPALQDIRRWLTDGVPGYPPGSPVVLQLAHVRAVDAYREVRALFGQANETALNLLATETRRLERFRNSLVLYLAAFAAFAVGVIVLFVRQRNAEAHLALERKRLTDSIESVSEGFALYDSSDRLVVCNDRYRDLYGSDLQSPGIPFSDLVARIVETGAVRSVDGRENDLAEARMQRRRDPGTPFEVELRDGRTIRVSEYATREGGTVGIHTDITDLKQAQTRLEHLANHDVLTGLPNRACFQDRLNHAIAQARRADSQLAVMFFDLDRFKLVNDTLGHASGDLVLRAVADSLKRCLRETDTVARLGGDEFAALIEGVHSWTDAASFAERMLEALAAERSVAESEIFTTASIGIAMFPQDGTDIPILMRNADAACYHAKSLGRNRYQFYTAEMNARAAQRLEIETHLRRALERDELSLVYQPQMAIHDGRISGLEAFLRWHSPQLGEVPPARFIPLAEEIGLIERIGTWVLERVCLQNRTWRDAGLRSVPVHVNVSARQFTHSELTATVARVLSESGLPADGLALEITESVLIESPDATFDALQELRALGVRLAIDDFGIGYSSLTALKRFPLDTLKVDASFVRDSTSDADAAEIVSAVIAMAHNLKRRVIAEGVETAAQLELLRSRGCDHIQGRLLAAPLPPARVTRYLAVDFTALPGLVPRAR